MDCAFCNLKRKGPSFPISSPIMMRLGRDIQRMEFFSNFNDPYSSFRLKTKIWGQNNKNLHYFCATTDMIVVTERKALCAKGNHIAKFCSYRTLTELDKKKTFVAMVTYLPHRQR